MDSGPSLALLREELASSIRRLEQSTRDDNDDAMDVDPPASDFLSNPLALLTQLDDACAPLLSGPGPSVPPPNTTTPSNNTKPLELRSELFSSVEAACNDLHGALRRNCRFLSGAGAGPSDRAPHRDALSDPDFLRSVVDYSRKISFGAHPGWFVPGQFFGDRRSWAPFAGDMQGSLLLKSAAEASARQAAEREARAADLRGRLEALKPKAEPPTGAALSAKAPPQGEIRVGSIVIPAMPSGWKPGDPIPMQGGVPAGVGAAAGAPRPAATTATASESRPGTTAADDEDDDSSGGRTGATGEDTEGGGAQGGGAAERRKAAAPSAAAAAAAAAGGAAEGAGDLDFILNPDLEILEYSDEEEDEDDF